jgi:hypothetical protein
MWSKMDSDLVDITRKSDIKWNTPSTGCYEAPSDFRLQSMGDFSSNGNTPIVAMLNYDVMLARQIIKHGEERISWYVCFQESRGIMA